MMLTRLILGLLSCSLLVGCAPDKPNDTPSLASIGADAVVLYGDSRVSQDTVQSLCGRPVYNAGISGATVGQVAHAIHWQELRQYPPRAVIVSVGINNTYTGQVTPALEVLGTLMDVTVNLQSLGVPAAVTTIMPPEAKDKGLWVDLQAVQQINMALVAWGVTQPAPILDLTLLAEPDMTTDGIHYRTAFYSTLHQAYEQQVCP